MLEIRLLGQPTFSLNNQPLIIKSRKAQAILAYLVTEQRPHTREKLAEWFWGEMDSAHARNNLSGILGKEFRTIRDTYLVTTPETIAFNPDAPCKTDIQHFQNRFQLKHAPLSTYIEIVEAYQAAFLDEFNVRNATHFEHWHLGQQERYHTLVLPVFNTLIWQAHVAQNWHEGVQLAQQLLATRPSDEKVRRLLMLLLVLNDQRVAALEHYETYYDQLQEDGNQPTSETMTLYRNILQDTLDDDLINLFAHPRYDPSETSVTSSSTGHDKVPFQVERHIPYFVGREQLAEEIMATLSDAEGVGLVGLIGMGGIGKTTLAIKVAHALRDQFPDGILWAKLAVSDPFSILESWALACGLDYSQLGDVESRSAAFRDYLEDKHMLLILDDVRRSSDVKSLLPTGEGCKVLLTTRDATIATMVDAHSIHLPIFETPTSLDLLSQLLSPQRIAKEQEAATVIADLLEHLPLALEITAKRLRVRPWTLTQTATRLQDVKNRLDELELRDLAVRATFEDSWLILSEEQQRFFADLAVFGERAFQLDAIQQITQLDRFATEDLLFDLVELSLVFTDGEWFWLHSLLADFAQEKLELRVDKDAVYQRMAEYYLEFVLAHQDDMPAMNAHWGNILAGFHVAYEHLLWEACVEYATHLYDVFFTQGHFTDARAMYPLSLEAARATDEHETQVDLLCAFARACIEQSDFDEARVYLDEGLTISEQIGYLHGIGETKHYLGRIGLIQANSLAEYDQTQWYFEGSREIFEELDDQAAIARNLLYEGEIPYRMENYDETKSLIEEARSIYKHLGDHLGEIRALGILAYTHMRLDDYGIADQFCQEAITLCEEIDDRVEITVLLYYHAEILRHLGKYQEAVQTIKESVTLLEQIGDQRTLAQAQQRLGIIYLDVDDVENALNSLETSLKLTNITRTKRLEISIRYWIGHAYLRDNQLVKACQQWVTARKLIQDNHYMLTSLEQSISANNC